MIKRAYNKLLNKKQALLSKRNVMKNRVALSVATSFSTLLLIFLMTGVLYFRNEVTIIDGSENFRVFTMAETADEVIKEQEIELGELDYYEFSGFVDSEAYLTIRRAIDVTISDGEESYEVKTKYLDDVATAISRAGLELSEFDSTVPDLTDKCSGGETININREVDVAIVCDGNTINLKSSTDTVEDLLDRAGIELGEDDTVAPSLNTKTYDGMKIVVQRVKYVDRITVETIPYQTVEVKSTLYTIGTEEVTTQGINGSLQITATEKVVDGKVVSREIHESVVTNEPVDEVISIGTALATPYSKREFEEIELENGFPTEYEYIVSGKACAYTAPPTSGTASGRKLQIGTVAVNPNIIPYGSLVYIVTQDGRRVYGSAVAADTGYLTDVVVDLFMGVTSEHYDDACNWGARYVDIYVINTGKY